MEALKIEILNKKALKLIEGMVELNLIRVSEAEEGDPKTYLESMRNHAESAPSPEEIAALVEEVRAARYANK